MRYITLLATLFLTLLLTACGGGGGSPGTNVAGGGTTATVVIPTPTLVVSLFNAANASVNTIAVGSAFTARATVRDAAGVAVTNRLVTFNVINSAIATVNPSTALTNTSGVAEVTIAPVSIQAQGATTLAASAVVGTATVMSQVDFSVVSTAVTSTPTVAVGIFNASNARVSSITFAGGFTARATVLDAAAAPVVNRLVTFSVTDGTLATLNPATALTNASGVAQVNIAPTSLSAQGATTLSANASLGTSTVATQLDFAVVPTVGVSTPTVTLTIVNAGNTRVSSIAVGGGFIARATVLDTASVPVANRLVTFSLTDSSIATLNPLTALTNASGVAEVNVSPASISAQGATTLAASATVGTATLATRLDFAVTSSSLTLSSIRLGSANLPSAGNTGVAVTALIAGVPSAAVPVNVVFAASCGRINGTAATVSVTTDGSGIASVVYTATNANGTLCSGPVAITASSPGAVIQTANLVVAAPVANAVSFISATPGQIFVAGAGAVEQSTLRYRAFAGVTPLPNVPVIMSFQVNPGGAGLNAAGVSANITVTTDSNGEALVTLFSGTIPGPVRIRGALVSDPSVFAESQNLTIASGPPSQRFMSLSVQTSNIEGQNIDGTSTRLTARLADRQGNAVADGTVVNFTAEGGQVAFSCATVQVNRISSCSVDFISQNPRRPNGRVSVLAFTEGTKDYVDVNGNNRFDPGIDTLIQLGDAFRDDNEDGLFQLGEFIVPRTSGGTTTVAQGWPFPSTGVGSDTLPTTVRQQAVLLFASSAAFITDALTTTVVATDVNGQPVSLSVPGGGYSTSGNFVSSFSFYLRSNDNRLLPMPAGTSVAVQAINANTQDNLACTVSRFAPTAVPNIQPTPNPLEDLSSLHSAFFTECKRGEDGFIITVTSPGGLITTFGRTFP
jgi:hypothetical protein